MLIITHTAFLFLLKLVPLSGFLGLTGSVVVLFKVSWGKEKLNQKMIDVVILKQSCN